MNNTSKATLSTEDRKTFFRLFMPLIDYTNQVFGVSELLNKQLRYGRPSHHELKMVADVIWENTNIIDEYIVAVEKQCDFEEADRRLLESWRNPVPGHFVLERHLTKGSIFINSETEFVYLVKGISDPWGVMLKDLTTPILLRTTLIPFRNSIISDGLIILENVCLGAGYRNSFKDIYMNAKRSNRIITSL